MTIPVIAHSGYQEAEIVGIIQPDAFRSHDFGLWLGFKSKENKTHALRLFKNNLILCKVDQPVFNNKKLITLFIQHNVTLEKEGKYSLHFHKRKQEF